MLQRWSVFTLYRCHYQYNRYKDKVHHTIQTFYLTWEEEKKRHVFFLFSSNEINIETSRMIILLSNEAIDTYINSFHLLLSSLFNWGCVLDYKIGDNRSFLYILKYCRDVHGGAAAAAAAVAVAAVYFLWPSRRGSGSLFFIIVAARQRQLSKKENLKNSWIYRKFSF